MWCPTCREMVEDLPESAQTEPKCPVCEAVLVEAPSVRSASEARLKPASTPDKTSDALKLLERWSDQRLFSPEGELPELKQHADVDPPDLNLDEEALPLVEQQASTLPEKSVERSVVDQSISIARAQAEQNRSVMRPIAPVSEVQRPTVPLTAKPEISKTVSLPSATVEKTSTTDTLTLARPVRINSPLIPPPNGMHFDVQAAIREQLMTQERSWISAIGYLFSYGGIALLTAGAGLTLWSFYDETLENIPKEWLVTTVGQIFLFAGMVMLVALIIERIGNKILFRISQIDDRITRIERALTAFYESQRSAEQPASKPLDVRKAG
ncbi:MAG: hypothetical protein R3C11_13250 [Planctomycetaceae bacterium]